MAASLHRLTHAKDRVAARVTGKLHALTRGLPGDPVRQSLPLPARRVRHQVRDGAAVMAFSAAASTGIALTLLLLASLAS